MTPWRIFLLFKTELCLLALTLECLILFIFLPKKENEGRTLSTIGMLGLVCLGVPLFWQKSFGCTLIGDFVHDSLSLFFKAFLTLAAILVIFIAKHSRRDLKRGRGEFVILILLGLLGMFFTVSANDFVLLLVGLEIMSVPLYVMAAYLRNDQRSGGAGLKFLLLGALSTAIFLFGLSFVYGASGSTLYPQIRQQFAPSPAFPAAFIFGITLIIVSLGFKMAYVPLHFWAPDVCRSAPISAVAYLSIGSKAAMAGALTRLMLSVLVPEKINLTFLFAILSALTITIGNLGAMRQTNLKRLMGYVSIAQAGYLLMGLAVFQNGGKEAILYYLLVILFSSGGVFLVLTALDHSLGNWEIKKLAGLSKRSQLLTVALLLSTMVLSGVLPIAGFVGIMNFVLAAITSGLGWLALVGILNIVPSLCYYFRLVNAVRAPQTASANAGNRLIVPWGQKTLHVLSIAGILVLSLSGSWLLRLIEAAFGGLLK